MRSNKEITSAIDKLIKVASQYPDDNLAIAIDDVRVIIRDLQATVKDLEHIIQK